MKTFTFEVPDDTKLENIGEALAQAITENPYYGEQVLRALKDSEIAGRWPDDIGTDECNALCIHCGCIRGGSAKPYLQAQGEEKVGGSCELVICGPDDEVIELEGDIDDMREMLLDALRVLDLATEDNVTLKRPGRFPHLLDDDEEVEVYCRCDKPHFVSEICQKCGGKFSSNNCEHGDHPAPEGKRFCSDECMECEMTECDHTVQDCAGVCGRRLPPRLCDNAKR